LGNGIFIINVTQSTFPLTVEFDACQILPSGDPMSQLQLQGYFFICAPSQDPQVKPGICPEWTDVARNTGYKGYTSPFMTILRAGPDPEILVRLLFPPSRTTDSLLTDYSQNYSCFRHTPLFLAKTKHLDWSCMTKEPSYFVNMSWGRMPQEQTL
jgi:hypothetical protein